MKPTLFVIGASLLVSSLAWAQPDSPTVPLDEQPPDGRVVEPPPPTPVMYREAPPPEAPAPMRPTAYSVGIGFGYRLPTDLNLPNITSVRFRLASGLTFEPTLALINDTNSAESGGLEAKDVDSTVALGALVRYPFRSHARVDFDLVGGVAVGSETVNPEGDGNSRTTTVFGVDYGIGLDYWLSQHWNLSFTATNPIIAVTKQTMDNGGGLADDTQTDTQLGLIFSPRVAVMLHLQL